MGYTHYWYREQVIAPETMKRIVEDFAAMVLRLDSLGVKLADGMGEGVPVITPSLVCFNGPVNCGHPKNAAVSIPWPSDNAHGVIDGKGQVAGSWFAGAVLDARCCNGDCSYETFSFPQALSDEQGPSASTPELFFSCTKTAYRPYDLAVNVFLVIAKHYLKDKIKVSSDGELNNWMEGIELCRLYLGYEESYTMTEDGLVPAAVAA